MRGLAACASPLPTADGNQLVHVDWLCAALAPILQPPWQQPRVACMWPPCPPPAALATLLTVYSWGLVPCTCIDHT